jgi:ribosome-associated toxin RatA of RatAB toxin-antitoxin module
MQKYILGLLGLSALLCFSSPLDEWALRKDEYGVQVFTRSLDWTNHKEYKGVVYIRASPEKLLSVIQDVSTYPIWMHNTYDAKLVRKSGNEFVTYFVNDAPWPVSDRDMVTKFVVNRLDPKTMRLDMTAAPKDVPEVGGMVRIPFLQGFWLFEDLGNGTCRVTQQVVSDPGGSIPAWLANSAIIDTPFNILAKLRRHIEGG